MEESKVKELFTLLKGIYKKMGFEFYELFAKVDTMEFKSDYKKLREMMKDD